MNYKSKSSLNHLNMNKVVILEKAAFYSKDRINSSKVPIESYISTDNIRPNKSGITQTDSQPSGNLIAFDKGDILVANIRPYLRKIWYADRKGGCSPDVLVFKSKDGYDPKFLYYSLFRDDFFQHMMKGSKGTKMPRGDKHQILRFHIPDFNITVQRKIADILSMLDLKIELNRKINAELDKIAKLTYDYWFLQFDFPNSEGRPYRASGGKMIWSDQLKKEIPEKWNVSKMSTWIEADKSGDWGNDESTGNYTEKVNCIRGTDINGLNGHEITTPPIRYILKKNSHKILSSHDLIIEISGGSPTQSTGRMAYITEETLRRFHEPLICSNFCKAISLKEKQMLYNFVYYWNGLYDSGAFFGYESKTSGIKNLLFDSFVNSYWTVVPDENIVNKFYEFMQAIQAKKQTALAENQKLAELRDWLLPMLMNGQVKVDDVEQELAMAAEPGAVYKKRK